METTQVRPCTKEAFWLASVPERKTLCGGCMESRAAMAEARARQARQNAAEQYGEEEVRDAEC